MPNCSELVEYGMRQLFGRRLEKIRTGNNEIRYQIAPEELALDGAPMASELEA